MNYLLVMPRLIQEMGDGYSFPLGITYISSSMKHAGYKVYTVNLNHQTGDITTIIRDYINNFNIDVVATGGLSFQYNTIKLVLDAARVCKSEIITIVGGGIITGDPEIAMTALVNADFGVIGEGEQTMNELCSALEHEADIAEIDGLIYHNGDAYVQTKPRKEVDNLDAIPWPDYDGFQLGEYLRSTSPGISGLNRKNTIFMLASRSCPYRCTFCFHTAGKKYRQRSMDSFFDELRYLTSHYEIDFICMADELFARDFDRVKEFCARMKKFNIRWWAQFRVDDITPGLLDILKDGGCEVMSFGLESADNRVLKSTRKHTTVEQIEKTLKMVYDSGIALEGAFIFGDIEETRETAHNTLRWWKDHLEYRINLNLITVYPGSYLYQYACAEGIINDKIQFLKDGCPQVNVSKLTDDDISEIVGEILEAPRTMTKSIDSVILVKADYSSGRIDFRGTCINCAQNNEWMGVKLFTTNFISCNACGQKFNVPMPQSIVENIGVNVHKVIEKYGKVGIWAVNYNTSYLFKNCRVLQDDNVYPIDISLMKRKMKLYGRIIHDPEIILAKEIPVIIIAIPAFFLQISTQINNRYQSVLSIIDICELTNPYFELTV